MKWISFAGFVDAIKESPDDRMVAFVTCSLTKQTLRFIVPDEVPIARKSNVVVSGYIDDTATTDEVLVISKLDISRRASGTDAFDFNAAQDVKISRTSNAVDEASADIAPKIAKDDAQQTLVPELNVNRIEKANPAPTSTMKPVPRFAMRPPVMPPVKPRAQQTRSADTPATASAATKLEPVEDEIVEMTKRELLTEKNPVDEQKLSNELAQASLYRGKEAMFTAGRIFTLYSDTIDDDIFNTCGSTNLTTKNDNKNLSMSGAAIADMSFQELMHSAS